MADIGQFALALAFATSVIGALAGIHGLVSRRRSNLAPAMLNLAAASASVAVAALLVALVRHDFQIKYISEHTDRAMSVVYLVGALWGGQSGSLLLWGFLLAIFSAFAITRSRNLSSQVQSQATVILLLLTCFFVSLVVFVEDPFERYGLLRADGHGLNPLLRTVEMLFHPPTLYFGFVGFSVPFALLSAAVWTGRVDAATLRSVRAWMLFSWGMLTVGIILGAEWAYVELGWGGFWAWDPVENASLLPWLTGTAALHSLMLTQRRGMLRRTTFLLVSLTFVLCVFGTLLTRSGIVASVHAFGGSPLLFFFLGLIAATFVFCVITLVARRSVLKSDSDLKSYVSREGLLAGGIIVLLLACGVVFWGTMLPVFSRMLTGSEKMWDPALYNIATVPFGLGLLGLMALGICLEGKSLAKAVLLRFAPAVVAGVVTAVVVYLKSTPTAEHQGMMHMLLLRFAPPLLIGGAVAVTAAVVIGVAVDIYRRQRLPARRRLGAFVAHLGVAALFLGMAGSGYVTKHEVTLVPDESTKIGRYTVTYNGLSRTTPPDAVREVAAELTFTDGDRDHGRLSPGMIFYKNTDQPHAEIGVRAGLRADLYAILSGYDGDRASFKLLINPLTTWLWIGGALVVLGTVAAAMSTRPKTAPNPQPEAAAAETAKAIFCTQCGKRIGNTNAKFCPYCGTSFEATVGED